MKMRPLLIAALSLAAPVFAGTPWDRRVSNGFVAHAYRRYSN